MSTIHVDLPGDLEQFVRGKLEAGKFANPSEYIVALVDAARRGQSSVEALLLEGLECGPAEPWTSTDFEASKQRLTDRYGKN